VTALVLGAAAGLKDTVQHAIGDAYAALKTFINSKYPRVDVSVIEADPKSPARRSVLLEELGRTDARRDAQLLALAEVVLRAVQAHAPNVAPALGVDLENVFVHGNATIEDINADSTGVRAKDVQINGDLRTRAETTCA